MEKEITKISGIMTNGRRDSGFTLIEIISVSLIVGLLFALATTSLDFLIPIYSLRGAAREIGSLARIANSYSADNGKDVYIVYDLPNGEYYLFAPQEKKNETEESDNVKKIEKEYEYHKLFKKRLPLGIEFVDVITNNGEKKAEGKVTIKVTPYGYSNHHLVNLKNKDNKYIAIKLNGFTGGLSFYDEYKEPMFSIEETD